MTEIGRSMRCSIDISTTFLSLSRMARSPRSMPEPDEEHCSLRRRQSNRSSLADVSQPP